MMAFQGGPDCSAAAWKETAAVLTRKTNAAVQEMADGQEGTSMKCFGVWNALTLHPQK